MLPSVIKADDLDKLTDEEKTIIRENYVVYVVQKELVPQLRFMKCNMDENLPILQKLNELT